MMAATTVCVEQPAITTTIIKLNGQKLDRRKEPKIYIQGMCVDLSVCVPLFWASKSL